MNSMLYIAILVISNLTDGIRDGNISRLPGVNWQLWHFIKWISYHSLTISLLVTQVPLQFWLQTAALCHLAFKLGYQLSLNDTIKKRRLVNMDGCSNSGVVPFIDSWLKEKLLRL
ncbi:MAG: hypothetical protein JXA96_05105 [Sedimentisphaerales bacterium]|nr:hypothetical protein [Sedimentisphaerales bacterium]